MSARTPEILPPAMQPSARSDSRHRIAREKAWSALAAAAALACASAGAPSAPAVPAATAPEAGALVVELVFGAEADLDLYVSDPSHETAYFANTPVRSGGAHARDARCDDRAPRVEVVRWEAPPPGTYRVGVDFPKRCDAGVTRARYRLRIAGPDGAREIEGEAAFGLFEPRVLDFEIGR